MGDLKLLVGYKHAGYRTTRGENYWWLHDAPQYPLQPPRAQPPPRQQQDEPIVIDDDNDLPEQQPPPQQEDHPRPPPERLNDVLVMLARNHRACGGQRQISWNDVHSEFSNAHPDINSTSQQLRNRLRTLQRRNPNLLE
jgi:hypothetical protein